MWPLACWCRCYFFKMLEVHDPLQSLARCEPTEKLQSAINIVWQSVEVSLCTDLLLEVCTTLWYHYSLSRVWRRPRESVYLKNAQLCILCTLVRSSGMNTVFVPLDTRAVLSRKYVIRSKSFWSSQWWVLLDFTFSLASTNKYAQTHSIPVREEETSSHISNVFGP